ncbi:SoxR reducing system RseC family protein [candidate division KSB1 bacterium]|nr:SoxR reducing system RseC family protein [candidate division KSB1 bacterium]
MEHEYGTVVKMEDDRVVIRLETSEQCNSCGAKDCCVSLGDENARQMELPTRRKFNVGDSITIGYEPSSRIFSAFLVFILPILFLIIGYFVGIKIFASEGKAILSAFAALAISFIFVRAIAKLLEQRESFTPVIVE